MARNDLATLTSVFDLPRSTPGNAPASLPANYNTAPTQAVFMVSERDRVRHLEVARWGLIPSWAKDPSIASRLINARSETVAEKPSFRAAFARRRCLIPVDGFYEWQAVTGPGQRKQPFYIHPAATSDPVGLAGLYEDWRNPAVPDPAGLGAWIRTCTILTMPATGDLTAIHHRMPVAVPGDLMDPWLAPQPPMADLLTDVVESTAHAQPGLWAAHPVTRAVNQVANNTVDLIRSAPLE